MIDFTKIPFKQSPNIGHNGRCTKEYIIIHSMAGFYQGSIAWFSNKESIVSAHYLVSQKGEVTQMAHDDQVAFHCHGINTRSLGIELEDMKLAKVKNWVTPELWNKAVELTAALAKKYHIPTSKILAHGDPMIRKINGPQFAHEDPGVYFSMDKFRADVDKKLKELK
jgi:N-acetylmuramoyl-L-alanine amidase